MSDAPWADPAWIAPVVGAAAGADLADPALTGAVELVVPPTAGRPRRPSRRAANAAPGDASAPVEVRAHVVLDAGRVTGAAPGAPDGDPVLTLTLPAPDLADMLSGTEPSVLFMQGRLKVDGDLRTALALLRASAAPGFRAGLEEAIASAGG